MLENTRLIIIKQSMQREARMKRELRLLETDPPPGISCWMVDDQIDHLQASKYKCDSHHITVKFRLFR